MIQVVRKPSCLALTVMVISLALFFEVIVGTACAKKLANAAVRSNKNGRGRRLELVTDAAEEFIPEASLYGIIPEPWNEQYGFIPWQRPYMDYNKEENSRYTVVHNWDYGSNQSYYTTEDFSAFEDGVGGRYTIQFYHNDRLASLNELGNYDCRIKKQEEHYNRNTTEHWGSYYNEKNGDYNFVKVPGKDAAERPRVKTTIITTPPGEQGNMIILGILAFVPFISLAVCIICCLFLRQKRVTYVRREEQ